MLASLYVRIVTSTALLHSLPMPYKESINNANIAYMQINTSTVWTLHVDF